MSPILRQSLFAVILSTSIAMMYSVFVCVLIGTFIVYSTFTESHTKIGYIQMNLAVFVAKNHTDKCLKRPIGRLNSQLYA